MLVICLLVSAVLFNYSSNAASYPSTSTFYSFSDSLLNNSIVNHLPASMYNKVGLIKKIQYKLLHKKVEDKNVKRDEGKLAKKNVLSTVSLILGIIGVVSLIIPSIAGIAVIAGPAALITGIIALGRRRNNTKASRTKAIIGLVLGAVLIFLGILGLILLLAFFSGNGW